MLIEVMGALPARGYEFPLVEDGGMTELGAGPAVNGSAATAGAALEACRLLWRIA